MLQHVGLLIAIHCIIGRVICLQASDQFGANVHQQTFNELDHSSSLVSHQAFELWPREQQENARDATQQAPIKQPADQQQARPAGGHQRALAEPAWHHSHQLMAASSADSQPQHQQLRPQPNLHTHEHSAGGKQATKSQVAPYQAPGDHHHHQQQQQQQQQSYFDLPSNLELALRQASGDESVFQPSPSLGAPRHSQPFDWLKPAPSVRSTSASRHPAIAAATPADSKSTSDQQQQRAHGRPQTPAAAFAASAGPGAAAASALASTTELSNSVVPAVVDQLLEPASASQPQGPQLNRVHQKEYATNANSSASATASTSVIEFNNQVIYEGPATAPPAQQKQQQQQTLGQPAHGTPADDYYFSATERGSSQNGELAAPSNAWWAIGAGDEFERASNLTRDNYRDYCDSTPLLVNNKQRSLCRMHARVMPVVARGIRMAIDECQLRFAHSRWNCSLLLHQHQYQFQQQQQASPAAAGPQEQEPRQQPLPATQRHPADAQTNSLASEPRPGNRQQANAPNSQIFGDVMRQPNRERSFLNAIFAAALAHSMTRACSQGELPEECNCDRRIKSKNARGRVEWVACSDDIDYGARFSRDFTDNFNPAELDTTTTIYMHNSEVGRRVFKSATDITCTCLNAAGENGLCQTKRCWKHLGAFADVVDEIMRRYESATHVQRSSKDPHKLRPVRRGVRKPKRKDLVYIDESPDYCRQDLRIGILGTKDRSCNSTSQGPDSCSLLCCGRGFQRIVKHIEEDCNCKFVWCCEVKCDKCSRFVTNDICN